MHGPRMARLCVLERFLIYKLRRVSLSFSFKNHKYLGKNAEICTVSPISSSCVLLIVSHSPECVTLSSFLPLILKHEFHYIKKCEKVASQLFQYYASLFCSKKLVNF